MTIFSDFHHSGLYYSLHLTFEKRLQHHLYRPVGLEWFERGFWDIAKPYGNSLETVRQYLSLQSGYKPIDGTPPLNNIRRRESSAFSYRSDDLYHAFQHKAITFQQFLEMDIDVIIASVPEHWYTYKRLRDQFKPKAKLICQMGNRFTEVKTAMNDGTIENLFASTLPFPVPDTVNALFYYQEQPLLPTYVPMGSPKQSINISSYVHLLRDPEQFDALAARLPEIVFRAYGAGNRDGFLHRLDELYASMLHDTFVYHVKPGGDGYGWNWHSAFLLGRPILTHYSDYKDCLGGRLFEHGVTGFDLEQGTVEENAQLIWNAILTGKAEEMGQEAYRRFHATVDYAEQGKQVQAFLERLH